MEHGGLQRRTLCLETAIAALTGANAHDAAGAAVTGGVLRDAPATWDAPILLALAGDAGLFGLVQDVRRAAHCPETGGTRRSFSGDDEPKIETDAFLSTLVTWLLDRADEMHRRLINIFRSTRRRTPRLRFGDFQSLLKDVFAASDIAESPMASELYDEIGHSGDQAAGHAAGGPSGRDFGKADDFVIVEPEKAATVFWTHGIFPSAAKSHRRSSVVARGPRGAERRAAARAVAEEEELEAEVEAEEDGE